MQEILIIIGAYFQFIKSSVDPCAIQKTDDIVRALREHKPDAVPVYGYTNAILAGVLAVVKLNIPVANAEVGQCSFNMQMPEEINRIESSLIRSVICFAVPQPPP